MNKFDCIHKLKPFWLQMSLKMGVSDQPSYVNIRVEALLPQVIYFTFLNYILIYTVQSMKMKLLGARKILFRPLT